MSGYSFLVEVWAKVLTPVFVLFQNSGQEEYERLRPLSYSKSHVILIAFGIDTPDSLDNVVSKVNNQSVPLNQSLLKKTETYHIYPETNTFLFLKLLVDRRSARDLRADDPRDPGGLQVGPASTRRSTIADGAPVRADVRGAGGGA